MSEKEKLKFSGMSFGGYWGGGTTIFSPHYKLTIHKNSKTKKFGFSVKKRRFISLFTIFMSLAIPLDAFYYILQFKTELLIDFINIILVFFRTVPIPGSGTSTTITIPIWIIETVCYAVLLGYFLFIYFFAFKGVATWHGCEHKLIASAENNDVENMRNYSRINDRCGGCYMFTLYTFMIVYWLTLYYAFNIFIPVGMLTLTFLLMFLERKYFHEYNWIGIRIGRILQDKITTAEPLEYQIELGIPGMKELLEKEKEFEKQNYGNVHFRGE